MSENQDGGLVLSPIDPGKTMLARLRHFSQPETGEAVESEKDRGQEEEKAHRARHKSLDAFGGHVGHQNWK
jgi:hypothetical protein